MSARQTRRKQDSEAEEPIRGEDVMGPAEVMAALGFKSKGALYALRSANKFPEPWTQIKLGPLWLRSQIEQFKRDRDAAAAEARQREIERLRAELERLEKQNGSAS